MTIKTASTLLIAATTLSAPMVFAEVPLRDGKYTLDIGTSGSSWVGGRMFLDSDSAIEASATLNRQSEDRDSGQASGTKIGASGGYMKYLSQSKVSPYWRAGGALVLYSGDAYRNQDTQLSGYVGVGAEYMIVNNVSIRGSVNGSLQLSPSTDLWTSSSDVTLSFFF